MIGKFAMATALRLLILTVLLAGHGLAQAPVTGEPPATPAPQQPATQQPSATQSAADQEATEEESTSRRKKPHNYKNWEYNVGLGANVDSGTTKTFVRGGGPLVAGGVARNASKYLGLRADAIFADLPLRQSSLTLAQAGSASSYLFALNVGPVIPSKRFCATRDPCNRAMCCALSDTIVVPSGSLSLHTLFQTYDKTESPLFESSLAKDFARRSGNLILPSRRSFPHASSCPRRFRERGPRRS